MTIQPLPMTDMLYERFRALIMDRSGLHFAEDKRPILIKRLMQTADATGATDLTEFLEVLTSSSSTSPAWEYLVSELTIGETYFFRNKGHFDALAKQILPELIEQRKNFNRRIRIWSAGCATGEEPYSLAILLRELIPDLRTWNVLILGTDINTVSLRQAREGRYRSWSFRGSEQAIQDKYFTLDGQWYVLDESIKRMVMFDYLNLVEDRYPSLANNTYGMDIILCRNVTIYFTAEVTRGVVHGFHKALGDGGWLIPGASEPNLLTYQDFEMRNFPGAVLYCKKAATTAAAAPFSGPSTFLSTATASGVASQPTWQPLGNNAAEPLTKATSSTWPGGSALPTPKLPLGDPFQEALSLLDDGRVDAALAKLYINLDKSPDHAPTYRMLGKIYANKGNFEEAQHWCERAIAIDRLHAEPYFTLSMIYQGHRLWDKAVEALKKTLYLDPSFALAHFTLGNLYVQQGKKDLGLRSLQNARRLLGQGPKEAPVPEGDGMSVGRMLELVDMTLASMGERPGA